MKRKRWRTVSLRAKILPAVASLQHAPLLFYSPLRSLSIFPFTLPPIPLIMLLLLTGHFTSNVVEANLNDPNRLGKGNGADENGMDDCRSLPHSNYLTAGELEAACEHRRHWLTARGKSTAEGQKKSKFTSKQLDYLASLQTSNRIEETMPEAETMEVAESANFDNPILKRVRRKTLKPVTGQKVIRREYRMLSDGQRADINRAMNAIKQKMVDGVSVWDLHTLIHYPDSAVGAHWGAAFLPWHREFLRQFEAALQREVPGVALPYWDSTLDHGLPQPRDSVMWSDELMGNGNGYVRTGPFGDWDTNVLMPLSPVPVKKLYRQVGSRPGDRLLSPRDAEWIVTRSNFSELTFCHDKTLESMHGLSHVWVGGFMFVLRVSPNDPAFYMHHSYLDFLWEQFRQGKQTRKQRERDYATEVCNENHAYNTMMAPFNLRNQDGLSNDYTDFWYEYEPVRHCNEDLPKCDSPYLFCDSRVWRCVSRVQLGGNCTLSPLPEQQQSTTPTREINPCYKSLCIQGTCRLPAIEGNGFERHERSLYPASAGVWAKTLMLTDDNRPLISGVAHINVREVMNGEKRGGKPAYIQRTNQYPEVPGLVYLPLPRPSNEDLTPREVTLEAYDHYGRYCQSYCLNATTENYQVCEPWLLLSTKLRSDGSGGASNLSFTHSHASRLFLDMDMAVHPSRWRVYTPYMVFACHSHMVDSPTVREIAELLTPPVERQPYAWFRVSLTRRASSPLHSLDELLVTVSELTNGNSSSTEQPDAATTTWSSPIRRARSANDPDVLFVRARNPRLSHEAVRVRVTMSRLLDEEEKQNLDDHRHHDDERGHGREEDCLVFCGIRAAEDPEDSTASVETPCSGEVTLHERPELSEEKVFASDPDYLPLLGWRMVGHPSEWRHQIPYLSFQC